MISKSKLNSVLIFGLIPLLLYSGLSLAVYFLFIAYILSQTSLKNLVLLSLVGMLTFIFVSNGPFYHSPWSTEKLAVINTTAAFFLLIISPWIKLNICVNEYKLTDLAIFLFLAVTAALYILGLDPKAQLQIGSFTIALYFIFSKKRIRKLMVASTVAIAGGRSIIAGAIYGLFMRKRPKLHLLISSILIISASILTLSGVFFMYFEEYLVYLKEGGIMMKGRTSFWLALLGNDSTWLGNGAGESIQTMLVLTNSFHLPHNDFLRIYVDYGLLLLVLILFSLWKNSLRGPNQLFGTAILAGYMLTGNPLSFATVIVSYILFLNCFPIINRKPSVNRRSIK